jgi:hypothetical protein
MSGFKRLLTGLVVAGVLVAPGCSGDGDKPVAAPATESTPTPAPPLSVAQYKAVLSGIEKKLKPLVARAMAAQSLAAVDSARVQLAKVLEQEYTMLGKLKPPPALESVNSQLQFGLFSYEALQKTFSTGILDKKNGCGLPKPLGELLYEAKRDIWWTVKSGSYGDAVKQLAAAKITFGKNLMPADPEPPPSRDRHGENGKVVQRSGPRGSGRLQITDDEYDDYLVVVSTSGPRTPEASIYVRANSKATLTGLRGNYSVYLKSGLDWDAKRRNFTDGCEYQNFLQIFDQQHNWKISLARSENGNAITNDIPAF